MTAGLRVSRYVNKPTEPKHRNKIYRPIKTVLRWPTCRRSLLTIAYLGPDPLTVVEPTRQRCDAPEPLPCALLTNQIQRCSTSLKFFTAAALLSVLSLSLSLSQCSYTGSDQGHAILELSQGVAFIIGRKNLQYLHERRSVDNI
jgi:hypothetical protein